MSHEWLEKLEQALEKGLDSFLNTNPFQDRLLREHTDHERKTYLRKKQCHIQAEATELREQILKLFANVREWENRSHRARESGATDLANRAEKHLENLMVEGRELWEELEKLGNRWNENETQIKLLTTHKKTNHPSSLEEKWSRFQTQQELDELKRKNDLGR